MTADRTRKPILEWDIDVLKDRMRKLGFEVEFLGKPVTFKNLASRRYENLDSIEGLDDESRRRIEAYVEEAGADGALAIDGQNWSERGDDSRETGHVTVALYKLKPVT
jgi:hypothetical protein